MVEADFRRFYGADLRDFWRRGSGMTYRWVISHIHQLPTESQWIQHHRREAGLIWDQEDHHRQDMVDLLQHAVYWLSREVLKGTKPQAQKALFKHAPKRVTRPGENQEKPQMTSKEGLREFFGTR